jgi:hypothetical protein
MIALSTVIAAKFMLFVHTNTRNPQGFNDLVDEKPGCKNLHLWQRSKAGQGKQTIWSQNYGQSTR